MKNESIDKILVELDVTKQLILKFRDSGKIPDHRHNRGGTTGRCTADERTKCQKAQMCCCFQRLNERIENDARP